MNAKQQAYKNLGMTMIKNFKNDLYVLGITESIKYLDSVNDDIEL